MKEGKSGRLSVGPHSFPVFRLSLVHLHLRLSNEGSWLIVGDRSWRVSDIRKLLCWLSLG